MPRNAQWVDLQVNGHNGVDFSSPVLTEDDVCRAAEELYETGTGIFLPTLNLTTEKIYRRNIPLIRHAVETHHLEPYVPGIHLDGPMINQLAEARKFPTMECSAKNVKKFYDLGGGFIKMITLSSDLPHSDEAITCARELGIITSVGHNLGGYQTLQRAADCGCRLITHLGNSCPVQVNRHDNPILAGLAEERMTAMIISDGHHLPDELIWIIAKVKGADQLIVTSHSCSLCGFQPGEYELWGIHAILESSGRLYNPEKHVLVASVATMSDCMRHLDSLQIFNEEELLKIGRLNPLKFLGITA